MEELLDARGLGPVAGVDEAGRGACCGPLKVAACILPPGEIPGLERLTDSKKLTPAWRERLYPLIIDAAVSWSVVTISATAIDARGIQHANISGMRRAVAALDVRPGYVLTDAWHIPGLNVPHLPVVGGDAVVRSISAASVLAKVARDRLMVELDATYPGYGFASHKGYSTKVHMAAVRQHGATPEHRYTYTNVVKAHDEWLSMQEAEDSER